MQVFRDALASADLPDGVVATIGKYDGIHRGQQTVLRRLVERARELACPSAVITFSPHPLAVLRPDMAPPRLTLDEQREELLAELGIDHLLEVRFNRDVARTAPEDFVQDFLVSRLALRELHVGSTFTFGRDRQGNVDLLRRLGTERGFSVVATEEVRRGGEVISASRIREAVGEGRTSLAMDLLGRPYALRGVIGRGDQMGKRLGWPTINLVSDNELLPLDGVYTGRVEFPNLPGVFDCVTNVGTRPTVYESYQRVVESHILGFSANVYGERVEVRFYKRLREEKMFSTVMDLSAQIGRDVEETEEYFAARRRAEELELAQSDGPRSAAP